MKTLTVQQARARLSSLIEEVSKGKEVLIGRKGEAVAVLKPYVIRQKARKPGAWKGRVRIAPDFDVLPPDVELAFQGEQP